MATDLQVVCDFCEKHLEANKAAFADPRLHLIVDDARAQLEKADGPFDVIIGDLADPVYGGPCYQVRPALEHTLDTILFKYRRVVQHTLGSVSGSGSVACSAMYPRAGGSSNSQLAQGAEHSFFARAAVHSGLLPERGGAKVGAQRHIRDAERPCGRADLLRSVRAHQPYAALCVSQSGPLLPACALLCRHLGESWLVDGLAVRMHVADVQFPGFCTLFAGVYVQSHCWILITTMDIFSMRHI